ncbi:helix-turn-helix domain-containing protein [Streptomyces sp. HUAS ZL42]|uniref:AraC-like ligand-binding domain-containing protein n=1 Tax=Streptomyces sp. HUAS ZL42 TaxID=3231715 RepID=UPI00345E6D56
MPRITTPSEGTASERLECWRDAVSRNLAPLDVLPRESSDFRASLHAARVGQVQMSVITAEPHSVVRTRRHIGSDAPDFFQLTLQLTGQGVLTQRDRQARVGPGELVVYDTRRPFTYDLDQRHSGLVLMFPMAMLQMAERDLARVTATPVSCHDGLCRLVLPFLYGLARQVEHLESRGTPRLADNVVDLIGTLLTEHADAARAAEEDGPGLLAGRILAYMEQRLADPRLSPEGIAAAHRISRRYLYKLLAEQGYTVSGWIREQRLARCRRDLADPAMDHLPVGAIGGRWGFPDPAHFSHAFKAAYGMSPREARASRRRRHLLFSGDEAACPERALTDTQDLCSRTCARRPRPKGGATGRSDVRSCGSARPEATGLRALRVAHRPARRGTRGGRRLDRDPDGNASSCPPWGGSRPPHLHAAAVVPGSRTSGDGDDGDDGGRMAPGTRGTSLWPRALRPPGS